MKRVKKRDLRPKILSHSTSQPKRSISEFLAKVPYIKPEAFRKEDSRHTSDHKKSYRKKSGPHGTNSSSDSSDDNLNHQEPLLLEKDAVGFGSYGSVYRLPIRTKYLKHVKGISTKKRYIQACIKRPRNYNEPLHDEIEIYHTIFNINTDPHIGKRHIVKFYGITKCLNSPSECIVMEAADPELNLHYLLHAWEDKVKDYQYQHDEKCYYSGNYGYREYKWQKDMTEYEDKDKLQPIAVMTSYSLPHVFFWMKQLAAALDFLHSIDLVHRDVKPANVLLYDCGRVLKLCDFGTTRKVSPFMTAERGTPRWMAPEIISSISGRWNQSQYDNRCDTYSLGIIFWECITRCIPFQDIQDDGSGSTLFLVMRIKEGDLKLPAIDNCPPMIQKCIEKMTHYKPEERLRCSEVYNIMISFLSCYDEKEYQKKLYFYGEIDSDEEDECDEDCEFEEEDSDLATESDEQKTEISRESVVKSDFPKVDEKSSETKTNLDESATISSNKSSAVKTSSKSLERKKINLFGTRRSKVSDDLPTSMASPKPANSKNPTQSKEPEVSVSSTKSNWMFGSLKQTAVNSIVRISKFATPGRNKSSTKFDTNSTTTATNNDNTLNNSNSNQNLYDIRQEKDQIMETSLTDFRAKNHSENDTIYSNDKNLNLHLDPENEISQETSKNTLFTKQTSDSTDLEDKSLAFMRSCLSMPLTEYTPENEGSIYAQQQKQLYEILYVYSIYLIDHLKILFPYLTEEECPIKPISGDKRSLDIYKEHFKGCS